MAAPMRHVLTNNLLHKYIKVDVCASKSLSFCKHGFNLNPILRENCSSLCENGIRNIHSLPPLLLTERGQSCSRNFGGGFRQLTASFFTASQYNTRQGHRFSGSSHQKSTGNFSLALGIGGTVDTMHCHRFKIQDIVLTFFGQHHQATPNSNSK